MAHSVSAKKRIRQNVTERARNRWRKSQIKAETKKFLSAVHDGDEGKAKEQFRVVSKELDKVAAKGTIHKNAAARRKSRLAAKLNAMDVRASN